MVKVGKYEFPEDLYYTKMHTYARIEGDEVIVGLDDFGGKAAGKIEFIDLPMEGEEVDAGDTMGSLETEKWAGELPMPVSGEVTEINEDVQINLKLLADDPYGEAWLVKVEASNLDDDLANLIHGKDQIVKDFTADLKERGML